MYNKKYLDLRYFEQFFRVLFLMILSRLLRIYDKKIFLHSIQLSKPVSLLNFLFSK